MDLKQISIMGTYSMYKFYKGEKENPFADKNEGNKAMFWEYEFTFDSAFFKRETYSEICFRANDSCFWYFSFTHLK